MATLLVTLLSDEGQILLAQSARVETDSQLRAALSSMHPQAARALAATLLPPAPLGAPLPGEAEALRRGALWVADQYGKHGAWEAVRQAAIQLGLLAKTSTMHGFARTLVRHGYAPEGTDPNIASAMSKYCAGKRALMAQRVRQAAEALLRLEPQG